MALPYLGLLLWATVAAAGFLVVDKVFNVWTSAPPAWLLAIAAGLFALIDWTESTQSFKIALRGESPPRRAFLDSIYFTRALGVVLFIFGAAGIVVYLATTIGAGTPRSRTLCAIRPTSPVLGRLVRRRPRRWPCVVLNHRTRARPRHRRAS